MFSKETQQDSISCFSNCPKTTFLSITESGVITALILSSGSKGGRWGGDILSQKTSFCFLFPAKQLWLVSCNSCGNVL